MTTAYFTDPRTHAHDVPQHPEHAGRLRAIEARFAETGIQERLHCLTPDPATDDQILTIHTQAYLQTLVDIEQEKRPILYGGDTYILPESLFAARLSAGAAIQAVEAVLRGDADNALVAMRPPGHHALPHRAMGFCLLANVSLAARHAQAAFDVERIMIVDYDVHHGNGTQDIFYDDPYVLFFSTHQSPFYPGTGLIHETGSGRARGTTVNVPLRAGYGDDALARIYEEVLWPAAMGFVPEIILVSAGFDTHWNDPLAGLTLTLTGIDHLTRELITMANTFCGGRIVFILEGGYNLDVVSHGMLNVAFALTGDGRISDPLPLAEKIRTMQEKLPAIDGLLAQLSSIGT
jgi:acetoin utilization deacetylase AcuC-like enzyme